MNLPFYHNEVAKINCAENHFKINVRWTKSTIIYNGKFVLNNDDTNKYFKEESYRNRGMDDSMESRLL